MSWCFPEAVAAQIGLFICAGACGGRTRLRIPNCCPRPWPDLLTELDRACAGDRAATDQLHRARTSALVRRRSCELASISERTLLSVLGDCLTLFAQSSDGDRALMAKVLHQLISGCRWICDDFQRLERDFGGSGCDAALARRSGRIHLLRGGLRRRVLDRDLCRAHSNLSHLAEPERLSQRRGARKSAAADQRGARHGVGSADRTLLCAEPLLTKHGLSSERLFALTQRPPVDLTEARAMRHLTGELALEWLAATKPGRMCWRFRQQVRLRLAWHLAAGGWRSIRWRCSVMWDRRC